MPVKGPYARYNGPLVEAETAAPGVCHSHDFCDDNMVIYAAFLRHGMDPASEGGMSCTARCGTKRGTWPSRGTFESSAEAALAAYLRGDDMKA